MHKDCFCDFVYKGLVQTQEGNKVIKFNVFLRLRLQRLGSNKQKDSAKSLCGFCDFVYKGLVQTLKDFLDFLELVSATSFTKAWFKQNLALVFHSYPVSATSFTKAWFKPNILEMMIFSSFCDFVYKGLVQT